MDAAVPYVQRPSVVSPLRLSATERAAQQRAGCSSCFCADMWLFLSRLFLGEQNSNFVPKLEEANSSFAFIP